MRTTLIVLGAIAALLGVITYFVVFRGSGNYVVTGNTASSAPSALIPVSSTLAIATNTASSTASSGPSVFINPKAQFSSTFTFPPVTWKEGGATLSITGASFMGTTLTLSLGVQMGGSNECVPLNIRLAAGETGALTPPQTTNFAFPESGTCVGHAGSIYKNQAVTFTVDPSAFPLLMTTGGNANIYFTVATSTGGGMDVEIPERSG